MSEDVDALGKIVWHSSEEDGGPDIGRWIGLGAGWLLWIGEISRQRYEDTGEAAAALGGYDGSWIILFGPSEGDTKVIGKAVDGYIGEDLLAILARAITAPSSPVPSQGLTEQGIE